MVLYVQGRSMVVVRIIYRWFLHKSNGTHLHHTGLLSRRASIYFYHTYIYEMTRCTDKLTYVNWIGTFQCKDDVHGRTGARSNASQTGQETQEMLERRLVRVCCVQATRFRGKSVKMINGKTAKYKLFWIENKKGLGEGIFLAEIWLELLIVKE